MHTLSHCLLASRPLLTAFLCRYGRPDDAVDVMQGLIDDPRKDYPEVR
jgi:hypothetical protein